MKDLTSRSTDSKTATGPPRPVAKRVEPDEEAPSKLHGKLQLVYLALKVLEVAAALLRGCL